VAMGNIEFAQAAFGSERWLVVEVAWGWCGLRRTEAGMTACTLPLAERLAAERAVAAEGEEARRDPLLDEAGRLLAAYFAGSRVDFELPLAPEIRGAFSRRVLEACALIPYGETRSYGAIAAAAGSPRAARAAGQALANNPLPVVIPCHRVVGADGRLVGFGAGLGMKRRLLALEGVTV